MFTVPNNSLWYICDITRTVILVLNIFPKCNSEKKFTSRENKK